MKTKTYSKNKFHIGLYTLLIIGCLLSSTLTFSQTFDQNFKFKTALVEAWKSEAWKDSTYVINTYDSNNYLTNSLIQLRNLDDTAWVDSFQSIFTNNEDGTIENLLLQQNVALPPLTPEWENVYRVTYTYTLSNDELTSTTEFWDNVSVPAEWKTLEKTINTYDGNGYLTKELTQRLDFFTSTLKDFSQIIYDNNPNGTKNIVTYQTYNIGTLSWDDTQRVTYTYIDDKEKTVTTENWIGGNWINLTLVTNTYNNSTGYLENMLTQKWDSAWINDFQNIFSNYNDDGAPGQVLEQIWEDTGGIWEDSTRITFTFEQLGIRDFESERMFTVYPNPVQDRITININEPIQGLNYYITDQIGRKCLNGTLNTYETTLDVNSLTKGIYFIQMGQNRNQTVKLIKR